jgi:hypothetical protein
MKNIGINSMSHSHRTSTGNTVEVLNTPIADTANTFASPALQMQAVNVEAHAPDPLAVNILTEHVQYAMDFVKTNKMRFDAEHLSINHVVAHSIKLHECLSIIT